MHPDQHTHESHRYRAPDSDQKPPQAPEQEQRASNSISIEETVTTVRTPEPEGDRVAEAGNAYTGRQMDDKLKANPRVEDADRAQTDD